MPFIHRRPFLEIIHLQSQTMAQKFCESLDCIKIFLIIRSFVSFKNEIYLKDFSFLNMWDYMGRKSVSVAIYLKFMILGNVWEFRFKNIFPTV